MSEGQLFEGHLVASGKRFAIISTRWNSFIVDHLIEGALDTIKRHGGDLALVDQYKVPGAFEVPMIAKMIAAQKSENGTAKYDGIIALGAVIRGSTPHFDYVANEAVKGIATVSLEFNVPISFGILTVDSIEQAIERAGTKAGNKGAEAALSTIEMADLFGKISKVQDKKDQSK
jgi:6,7-dimethyl-8-ribityllumazine synthase